MKLAFVLRGLPGSGKSTVARRLAGEDGVIHSTDNYRYNQQGEYVFDPEKTFAQHQENFEAFGQSLRQGIEVVVCDNTNTTRSEYERYVKAAQKAGYLVSIVVLPHPSIEEALKRNGHGVPREIIEAMLKRWEP
jgi:NEDD4-binding protein 2